MAQLLLVTDIVKDYGSRLKHFIRNRVKSAEDAEDILQDVFYQLTVADQLMHPIEQVSAWIFTVARNRITDLYRKKKPEPASQDASENLTDSIDDDVLSEIGELMFEAGNNPEMEYLNSLVWIELEKALDELPPEQRMVFEMNELQDIPFKEIARLTGESQNTLISRKRYAVLHLRKRLKSLYDELLNY